MGWGNKLSEWLWSKPKGFIATSEKYKENSDSLADYGANSLEFDFIQYCEDYNALYERPKIKSAVLSIAGQVMGDGIYLTPATKRKPGGKRETYPRAEEASELCQELNERIHIDTLTFDTAVRMVKYGNAFWEKTFDPIFSARSVINMPYIKPRFEVGEIVGWNLGVHDKVIASWGKEQIIHFPWNIDRLYPFGTSLLTGVTKDIDTLDHITSNVEKYMKRQAFATDVLQLGDKQYTPGADEMDTLTNKIARREIGDVLATNYTVGKATLGGGDMETRMVPDMLKFVDDQITDSLMSPPVSRLYNSTEASATVMSTWTRAVLICPLQRIIQEKLKWELYYPYLEDQGFGIRSVPDVIFNSPETGKNAEADYWLKMIQGGVVSPMQVAREIGVVYDEAYWKSKMEAIKAQAQALSTMKQQVTGQQIGQKPVNPEAGNQIPKPKEKTGPKPEVNSRASETLEPTGDDFLEVEYTQPEIVVNTPPVDMSGVEDAVTRVVDVVSTLASEVRGTNKLLQDEAKAKEEQRAREKESLEKIDGYLEKYK